MEFTEEQYEKLQEVMSQLGEAHTMIAKTKLPPKEYNPISAKLSKAKVGLFNIYYEIKLKKRSGIGIANK